MIFFKKIQNKNPFLVPPRTSADPLVILTLFQQQKKLQK